MKVFMLMTPGWHSLIEKIKTGTRKPLIAVERHKFLLGVDSASLPLSTVHREIEKEHCIGTGVDRKCKPGSEVDFENAIREFANIDVSIPGFTIELLGAAEVEEENGESRCLVELLQENEKKVSAQSSTEKPQPAAVGLPESL